jgi:hypothetical protein
LDLTFAKAGVDGDGGNRNVDPNEPQLRSAEPGVPMSISPITESLDLYW